MSVTERRFVYSWNISFLLRRRNIEIFFSDIHPHPNPINYWQSWTSSLLPPPPLSLSNEYFSFVERKKRILLPIFRVEILRLLENRRRDQSVSNLRLLSGGKIFNKTRWHNSIRKKKKKEKNALDRNRPLLRSITLYVVRRWRWQVSFQYVSRYNALLFLLPLCHFITLESKATRQYA